MGVSGVVSCGLVIVEILYDFHEKILYGIVLGGSGNGNYLFFERSIRRIYEIFIFVDYFSVSWSEYKKFNIMYSRKKK